MNTLNNIVKSNLKLNKSRTLVTLVGIILSVALLSAVSSIYMSAIKSYVSYEKNINGNFHASYMDVPKKDLKIFNNNKKIEKIYYTEEVGYAKINSKNEYKPYAYVDAFSSSALENLVGNVVKGRLPKNENEIVIPSTLKTNGRLNLKVGETITLDVGTRVSDESKLNQSNPYNENENINNTIEKKYKIVGITKRLGTSIEPIDAPGYTFITYLDENKRSKNTNIYVRYKEKYIKDAYKLTADILGVDRNIFEKSNDINKVSDLTNEDYEELSKARYEYTINEHLLRAETDPLKISDNTYLIIVTIIVIIIIIFTSVFCIKSSFDISVSERIKQYGLLKSIGATKKQIKKNILYEGFILGLIGIPLGIIIGILASMILVVVSNYFMKLVNLRFTLTYSFSILSILITIILGILTIYLSGIRVANKTSKISPLESIRNENNITVKPKTLRTPKIINKLFGIGGTISYKNIKRNGKKYRVTILGVIIGAGTVIALSEFVNLAFNNASSRVNVRNFNLSLIGKPESESSLKKHIETTKLEDIKEFHLRKSKDFETELYYSKDFKKKLVESEEKDTTVNVISIEDKEYESYIKELGLEYNYVKDKGILLDFDSEYEKSKNELIHNYNVKAGDTINIKNQDSDNYYDIEIISIPNTKPSSLDEKGLDIEGILVSSELFKKITNDSGAYNIQIEYNSVNPNKTQDEIESILNGESFNLTNEEEINEQNRNLLTLVRIFLYGFIIVIALISITSTINIVTSNVMLRSKEFASLKSIGMTKKEFDKMIKLEGTFIEIKSLFYGIAFGLILSYVIYYFFNKGEAVTYYFPLKEIIILIIVVVIFIDLIMKYSEKKINKQNIIETIRSENI